MISAFMGEFMLHPCPIEYSGDTCSHNCGYCFANIRSSCRRADMAQTMNIITGRSKSNGVLNFLFKHGHPICISNRTDPFSKSNVAKTHAVLKVLAQQPNGIFFQTKGGEGIDEALDILRGKQNVVFYITITTMRDEISKRMEPGAPLPSERVKLAKQLRAAGYPVIIGLNPIVETWMPEPDLIALEDDLLSAGVKHYMIQKLLLNRKDINSFSAFRRSQFTDSEIESSLSKSPYFITQTIRQLERGLSSVSYGMPCNTDFHDELSTCLGRTFKNLYALISDCFKRGECVVTFSDFERCMIGENTHLYEFSGKEIPKYIMTQQRAVWKNPKVQGITTYRELLRVYWNNNRMSASPQNNNLFRVMTENGKTMLDEHGDIILYFDKTRHYENRTCEKKGGENK